VPLDFQSAHGFADRVRRLVGARLVLIGDDIPTGPQGDAAFGENSGMLVWRLAELDWAGRAVAPRVQLSRDDLAEIIFTSGATAEPKGVLITHRNILANLVPIEREIEKHRKWGRPFFPLRFLEVLPLSHLFGQAMATLIPPLLPGTVVFARGVNPAEIVRQVHTHRVSVVVCVPKILDVLREHLVRLAPEVADPAGGQVHVARRWWRYRRLHRMFGLKFWSFVVGAAPLDPALEEFWSRLGFLVIQGYGLTETAPIVSLNHPFAARKGSVGKAMPGTEVRIAPDGEILVRGENVTRGYYGGGSEQAGAFEDGWLHTGDVGEVDAQGRLFVRGRKKEMIVTPEGLNVFPEDVERVLDSLPGVHESAVVGTRERGEERVHAVLVADPGLDTASLVRDANARLAEHQRIRGVSLWPGPSLPRTDGTQKLKRTLIRQWVETGQSPAAPRGGRESLDEVIARFAGGRTVGPGTTLEELGLSSLDRVELMVALEDRFNTTIDESSLTSDRTLGEVRAMIGNEAAADTARQDERAWRMPDWNRTRAARWFRNVSLAAWVLPLARLFAHLQVEGLEHLQGVDGPVLFAANHQSHLDTPVVLAALPARWRYRLAVAMSKEFFAAHFHPDLHTRAERLRAELLYTLAALYFDAFPLPQREAGTRRTLRYVGDLLDAGLSVLVYPEGERTETGAIGTFRPGIGMMGARLSAPVVPVRLEGVERVLHRSWQMARPGRVRVAFGRPLRLEGDEFAELAARVEEAVRSL
jgi:long-chain acyl-CoA synthetase